MPAAQERRLAAIMAADVVGYSRLIEADEAGTLAVIKGLRRELIDPLLGERHGRLVKLMGDGIIVEFGSVVDAVACAVERPGAADARQRRAFLPERRIVFRIGVNLGDVLVEGEDLLGDGVNIAARLEQLCRARRRAGLRHGLRPPPGQARPRDRVPGRAAGQEHRPPGPGLSRGPRREPPRRARRCALPDRPSIAVLPFDNLSGDPEQDYFADGMVEEIITALSKISGSVRHRPQLQLHLQGPHRRCEAGRPRAGRPLCPRGQRPQGRRPRADHRAAHRRGDRHASLGRPVRRRA